MQIHSPSDIRDGSSSPSTRIFSRDYCTNSNNSCINSNLSNHRYWANIWTNNQQFCIDDIDKRYSCSGHICPNGNLYQWTVTVDVCSQCADDANTGRNGKSNGYWFKKMKSVPVTFCDLVTNFIWPTLEVDAQAIVPCNPNKTYGCQSSELN